MPSLLLLALAAAPLSAPVSASSIADRQLSSPALYVRSRAAEVGGDAVTANTGFAALLQRDPASDTFAQRSFRQALSSGDEALALKAARLLDSHHALPPDGRLLLMADAVRSRDWTVARHQADLVQQERLFAFLVPMLRAWIAFGAGDKDPLASLDGARGLSLAQPFLAEQRALLLIALGRANDGIAALRSAGSADISAWPVRVRLLAADALRHAGQVDRARGLLDGDDPALVTARAALSRGEPLAVPITSAAAGIGALFVRVAADFGRQQLAPAGLALAREATFLEPRDAGAFLTVANLLAGLKEPREALAALDHVPPGDPFASAAQSLRVAILSQLGDQAAALADARRATETDGDRDAWSRLGDVYLSLDQPADAAAAYGRAVAQARDDKAPAARLWPLLLQQADALDRAGRWGEAKPALEAALALAPDQPLVQNQVGYSLIAHRDEVARGSKLIDRASAARPDDSAITDSLGWSRFLLGAPAAAVPVLERASAADPAEPTIAEHLGDAYWAVGRRYEARFAWRAALVTADDKDKPRLSSKIDLGYTPATASP